MKKCMVNIEAHWNKKRIIIIISWAAVLAWMLFIFKLSAQVAEASNSLSTGISEVIIEAVEKVAPEHDLDIRSFNHMLRKNAHFTAYLILGILTMNALGRNGIRGRRQCILAMGICSLYAVSDEVHQLFVPGRGGQIVDVLIDSAGAAFGVGAFLMTSLLFCRNSYYNKTNNQHSE